MEVEDNSQHTEKRSPLHYAPWSEQVARAKNGLKTTVDRARRRIHTFVGMPYAENVEVLQDAARVATLQLDEIAEDNNLDVETERVLLPESTVKGNESEASQTMTVKDIAREYGVHTVHTIDSSGLIEGGRDILIKNIYNRKNKNGSEEHTPRSTAIDISKQNNIK